MNDTDRIFIVLLFLFTNLFTIVANEAKAGPYVEVGIGMNMNITGCTECWDDGDGTGTLLGAGYHWRHNTNWTSTVHWTHLSQVDVGFPFNSDPESSVDHVGIKLTYEW